MMMYVCSSVVCLSPVASQCHMHWLLLQSWCYGCLSTHGWWLIWVDCGLSICRHWCTGIVLILWHTPDKFAPQRYGFGWSNLYCYGRCLWSRAIGVIYLSWNWFKEQWCLVCVQLLDNRTGDLCSHYPPQLVVLEYVKSEDSLHGKLVTLLTTYQQAKSLFRLHQFAYNLAGKMYKPSAWCKQIKHIPGRILARFYWFIV